MLITTKLNLETVEQINFPSIVHQRLNHNLLSSVILFLQIYIIRIGVSLLTISVHLLVPRILQIVPNALTATGILPKFVTLYKSANLPAKNSLCSGRILSAAAIKYVQTRACAPLVEQSRSRTFRRSCSTRWIDSSSLREDSARRR
jgi:hypothetical protein